MDVGTLSSEALLLCSAGVAAAVLGRGGLRRAGAHPAGFAPFRAQSPRFASPGLLGSVDVASEAVTPRGLAGVAALAPAPLLLSVGSGPAPLDSVGLAALVTLLAVGLLALFTGPAAPSVRLRRGSLRAVLFTPLGQESLAPAIRANAPDRLRLAADARLPETPRDVLAPLRRLSTEGRIDIVFVAAAAEDLGIEALLWCEARAVRVLSLETSETAASQRRHPVSLARLAWFEPPRLLPSRTRRAAKRLLDICLSIGLLVALCLPMALIALLVRRSSPGPALYSQVRVGRGGKPFVIYKFRTMVAEAERATGAVLAHADDPRLTRLGKRLKDTGLDELPQLWNVLRGQMSMVGPRPERPEFVDGFSAGIPNYPLRHIVRPGVTGVAQLAGDYRMDPDHKLRCDLWYVAHCSLRSDLRLLLATPLTIAGRLRPAAPKPLSASPLDGGRWAPDQRAGAVARPLTFGETSW